MTNYRQDEAFRNEMVADDLLPRAIEWIRANLSPEDVFPESELVEWAEDRGYTKAEA
jgi:hypothetical protein